MPPLPPLKPIPASQVGAGEPITDRELLVGQVETALDFIRRSGIQDASAAWRLARCVGWLSRSMDAKQRELLVYQSIREGIDGQII